VLKQRRLKRAHPRLRPLDRNRPYCPDDATQPAICALELNPSLFRMLRTWLSTVRSDMNRLVPIGKIIIKV
jgi:hypothetical protein